MEDIEFELQQLNWKLEETIRYANRARQALSVLGLEGCNLPDNIKQFVFNEVYRAARSAYSNCAYAMNTSEKYTVDPDDDWIKTMNGESKDEKQQ